MIKTCNIDKTIWKIGLDAAENVPSEVQSFLQLRMPICLDRQLRRPSELLHQSRVKMRLREEDTSK